MKCIVYLHRNKKGCITYATFNNILPSLLAYSNSRYRRITISIDRQH